MTGARWAVGLWVAAAVLASRAAWAGDEATPAESVPVDEDNAPAGYTPSESGSADTLRFTGYVDVGFVKAFGNGSSFVPNDVRVPADYGSDAFAPAVNSRGDVASTDANGRFTNGFLPRSVGIGATPSFLLNTASVDVRFTPKQLPLFVFVRAQAMPRFSATGDATRFDLQQAFGKLTPFSAHEFAVSLGRFDSVFGIEYLENEANLRTNITPSLIARYTTGQSLGLKVFYRFQFPSIWSAISLNAAATNSGTRVEALVPADASLVGVPVGSARLGYELNLKAVQVKAGVSGLYGPRNDQRDPAALQRAFGADLRVSLFGVAVAGEIVRLSDSHGPLDVKVTGQSGPREIASGFEVWGGWARLAYTLPFQNAVFSGLTLFGRYDKRWGQFEGFTQLVTDRITVGFRLDLFDMLALKAEYLFNREVSGAPRVDNDVFTSSVVLTW